MPAPGSRVTSASDCNSEHQQLATIPTLFLNRVMSSHLKLGAPGDVLVEPGARHGQGKVEQLGQPAAIETDHPYSPRAAPVGHKGEGRTVRGEGAQSVPGGAIVRKALRPPPCPAITWTSQLPLFSLMKASIEPRWSLGRAASQ
jgi:hypothetical protein